MKLLKNSILIITICMIQPVSAKVRGAKSTPAALTRTRQTPARTSPAATTEMTFRNFMQKVRTMKPAEVINNQGEFNDNFKKMAESFKSEPDLMNVLMQAGRNLHLPLSGTTENDIKLTLYTDERINDFMMEALQLNELDDEEDQGPSTPNQPTPNQPNIPNPPAQKNPNIPTPPAQNQPKKNPNIPTPPAPKMPAKKHVQPVVLPTADKIGAAEAFWNLSSIKINDDKMRELISHRLGKNLNDAAIVQEICDFAIKSNGGLRLLVINKVPENEIREKIAQQVNDTLPKIKQQLKPGVSRDDLMEQIRQGIKLKKVGS